MFTIGQLVKFNPDLIPETAKDDELYGELGAPGLMKHMIFEVTKVFKDQFKGEMVTAKLTNPEFVAAQVPGSKGYKSEGEVTILIKELIPANTKVTIDYIIHDKPDKTTLIKELFDQREKLKARFGQKKSHPELRDNWRKIQVLRGQVDGPIPALGKVRVELPKYRINLEVEAKDLPNGTEKSELKFKRFLSGKVRSQRSEYKRVKTVKKILFDQVEVELIGSEKYGFVYTKEKVPYKAYEEMMKTTLDREKTPSNPNATYVGIEIEMIYSGNNTLLRQLLIKEKLARFIQLKQDNSVKTCHNVPYKGIELTLLCRVTELKNCLTKLDRVLRHPEIDAYANGSCGLHVHIDVRKRDAQLVYTNFVRIQNILRGSQPARRVNNLHCKISKELKALPSLQEHDRKKQEGNREFRYLVVNPWCYPTLGSIEIRIHEGTVDCDDIYNWIDFLNAVASYKKEIPKNELKYSEDLVGRFNIDIPPNAIEYIDSRIDHFNSLTAV